MTYSTMQARAPEVSSHADAASAEGAACLRVARMRLRITIALEVEAGDFIQAASHQQRLQAFLERVRDPYPDASLRFWERREKAQRSAPSAGALKHYTGRLNRYEDV
jgi:hypothetical protein